MLLFDLIGKTDECSLLNLTLNQVNYDNYNCVDWTLRMDGSSHGWRYDFPALALRALRYPEYVQQNCREHVAVPEGIITEENRR